MLNYCPVFHSCFTKYTCPPRASRIAVVQARRRMQAINGDASTWPQALGPGDRLGEHAINDQFRSILVSCRILERAHAWLVVEHPEQVSVGLPCIVKPLWQHKKFCCVDFLWLNPSFFFLPCPQNNDQDKSLGIFFRIAPSWLVQLTSVVGHGTSISQ